MTTPAWPPAYLEFIERFNRGEYWESHEVLEAPWRKNRSTFYKGLIIYASAFVHAQRGNPRGVRKQLVKAERYLQAYVPHYLGLDVERLLERVRAGLAQVDVASPPSGEALWAGFIRDRLELSPARLRGDEPEMW